MRKTAITILLMTLAAVAYGQTAYDALTFSENNYEGSARTVAMGNAFTALGGDIGAVSINPAGSAVAGYSQFAITPALTFSTATSQGVSPYANGDLPYFQKQMKSSMTKFAIPNFGVTFNWDTGRRSGLKQVTFGFILSKTAAWDEDIYAAGENSTTSFMGQMAAEATDMGYTGAQLGAADAYDYMPWKAVAAYQSGMISTYGAGDNHFVGASELIFRNPDNDYDEIVLGGPLNQTYGRRVAGTKYDYIFNLGANISDFLYLGANLGINALEYGYSEYFKEKAVDPSDFGIVFDDGPTVYFEQMRYNYGYSASGSGFFAKVGFILTPANGLRIGGAIQTPTLTTINETWDMSASTTFSDSGFNGSSSSPYGENTYSLRSPMRANLGVAYTFGNLGLLSIDYEVCDYSGMRFKGSSYDRDYFEEVNAGIREIFGAAHSVRAGAEVKPLSCLALRAGYNISTNPDKTSVASTNTQNISFGAGYSSKGSFFTDFAIRKTILADEYFMPYADYIFDGNSISAPTPELRIHQSLWKAILTFGWRF